MEGFEFVRGRMPARPHKQDGEIGNGMKMIEHVLYIHTCYSRLKENVEDACCNVAILREDTFLQIFYTFYK